jgi:choline dehydrogenase
MKVDFCTGVKFIVNLYEKTVTYKKLNARLVSNPLPGCEAFKIKSDEYYECYIRHLTLTLYHPSSTVAMGRSHNDSKAVVDSELRSVLNL